MRNALSVDVEDYYQVSAFADRIPKESWEAFEPRVVRNTLRLLALFERAGVRATFFVLGWVAERNPGLVEAIHEAGHEVACHGYSHDLIYRQSPERFREETVRAKQVLEEIVQAPVTGYRAASFSIVERTRWALDILHEAGFIWDSSIYPIRHDRYGLPGACPEPHRLVTPAGRSLIEFPPTAVDLFGWRFPAGGGGYLRLYPYWLTRAALRRANRTMPFMVYLHPWEIDPGQPRIAAPPLARFRHYVNLGETEGRLIGLLRDFSCAPVGEVLAGLGLLPAGGQGEREVA